MATKVKILVVGVGNMGRSHALAYHTMDGFEIVGLVSPSIKTRELPDELAGYPKFTDYDAALADAKPDAVSINTYPDSYADLALKAFDADCHVFMEKPIATNAADAEKIVGAARAKNKKLVVGYILRVHPAWQEFIRQAQGLGKPLVMRMNLNQQSKGEAWGWHRNLMESLTPLVDCGVHYVDVMCQMTGAKPVRVHGIGAKLSADTKMQNYGHLHVEFDDGSVGWYEAGWGPMMSEVAFFVKDVVGPKGHVSIVPKTGSDAASSDNIDSHTQTNSLLVHSAELDDNDNFVNEDTWISMADEPGHDDLCYREQEVFYKAITEGTDLSEHMDSAVNSLKIVLAADESIKLGEVVHMS
ncbi:MAG: Gfo/Idh/MocA family oxidoreductase [Alphaproteobacteria bacterium]|nr:Gfo/Idh/MocA family oxidoreductase [Alphaproteobacteria bacterium]